MNDKKPGLDFSRQLGSKIVKSDGYRIRDYIKRGEEETRLEKGSDLIEEKANVASQYLIALMDPKTLFISTDGTTFSNHKMQKKG